MPGDPGTLELKGVPVADTPQNRNRADLDFRGSVMPPAGKPYIVGQDGRPVKMAPLTDEDRMTIVRWIDLGCPIDSPATPRRLAERAGCSTRRDRR